jgi:hypothetical protein
MVRQTETYPAQAAGPFSSAQLAVSPNTLVGCRRCRPSEGGMSRTSTSRLWTPPTQALHHDGDGAAERGAMFSLHYLTSRVTDPINQSATGSFTKHLVSCWRCSPRRRAALRSCDKTSAPEGQQAGASDSGLPESSKPAVSPITVSCWRCSPIEQHEQQPQTYRRNPVGLFSLPTGSFLHSARDWPVFSFLHRREMT